MGGMGGGKGAPEAPDFTAAAEAQSRSAHSNQSTPWATSKWTQSPYATGYGGSSSGGPAPTSMGGVGRVGGNLFGGGLFGGGEGSPVDGWENAGGGVGGGPGGGQWSQELTLAPGLDTANRNLMAQIAAQGPAMNGDRARDQAITGAYDQASSRLDPQWAQRETEIRSRLANSGLDPGSEAYSQAMGSYGRDRNDAYTSAMADAIRQGTSAGAVTYEQNRQAQMLPFQQVAAIQGLSGMPANPGATQYLDAANAAYGGALNQYATQQGGKNSMLSGAASLAPLFFTGGAAGAAGAGGGGAGVITI